MSKPDSNTKPPSGDEMREKLIEILSDVWHRGISADEGLDAICDLLEKQADKVRELEKDKARLDWLQNQGYAFGFEDMHEGNRWEIQGPYVYLRDAIDDAMKGE
jgi:glutamate synthase domain-containing protein 1